MSKFEELGAVTGDLGLSAIKLAKFEDADGSRCGAYTDSTMASKSISADSKRVGMVRNMCDSLCKEEISLDCAAAASIRERPYVNRVSQTPGLRPY